MSCEIMALKCAFHIANHESFFSALFSAQQFLCNFKTNTRESPAMLHYTQAHSYTHTHTHANRHRSGQSVGRPALSFYPTTADQRCWPRYQHEQQRQQRLLKREKQEKLHKRRPQQFSTLLIRGFQRIKRAAMRFVVE